MVACMSRHEPPPSSSEALTRWWISWSFGFALQPEVLTRAE